MRLFLTKTHRLCFVSVSVTVRVDIRSTAIGSLSSFHLMIPFPLFCTHNWLTNLRILVHVSKLDIINSIKFSVFKITPISIYNVLLSFSHLCHLILYSLDCQPPYTICSIHLSPFWSIDPMYIDVHLKGTWTVRWWWWWWWNNPAYGIHILYECSGTRPVSSLCVQYVCHFSIVLALVCCTFITFCFFSTLWYPIYLIA